MRSYILHLLMPSKKCSDFTELRRSATNAMLTNSTPFLLPDLVPSNETPDQYISNVMQPDNFSGEIEIAISSQLYQITLNVIGLKPSGNSILPFNEGQLSFCILLLSGHHYKTAFQESSPNSRACRFNIAVDLNGWRDWMEKMRRKPSRFSYNLVEGAYRTVSNEDTDYQPQNSGLFEEADGYWDFSGNSPRCAIDIVRTMNLNGFL